MDEARRFRQGGAQLVAGPLGGRVLCDVDAEDAAPSVAEDHEAVEDAEAAVGLHPEKGPVDG